MAEADGGLFWGTQKRSTENHSHCPELTARGRRIEDAYARPPHRAICLPEFGLPRCWAGFMEDFSRFGRMGDPDLGCCRSILRSKLLSNRPKIAKKSKKNVRKSMLETPPQPKGSKNDLGRLPGPFWVDSGVILTAKLSYHTPNLGFPSCQIC